MSSALAMFYIYFGSECIHLHRKTAWFGEDKWVNCFHEKLSDSKVVPSQLPVLGKEEIYKKENAFTLSFVHNGVCLQLSSTLLSLSYFLHSFQVPGCLPHPNRLPCLTNNLDLTTLSSKINVYKLRLSLYVT